MNMIDKEVYAALKAHCKENGLKVKFILNNLIKDYLYDNDEHWDREEMTSIKQEMNRDRIHQLLNKRKERESK